MACRPQESGIGMPHRRRGLRPACEGLGIQVKVKPHSLRYVGHVAFTSIPVKNDRGTVTGNGTSLDYHSSWKIEDSRDLALEYIKADDPESPWLSGYDIEFQGEAHSK